MRVLEKGRSEPVNVYGIYWLEGKKVYWVIPYAEYEGLITLSEDDCELIDPKMSDVFVLRKNGDGGDLFLHWAVNEDDLFYDLVEHDPIAMELLLKKVGAKDN